MQRSDGDSGSGNGRNGASLAVNRRSYLKLAGVAAGSASVLSGPASAAFTRRGIRFERTVDMVADAGCDPTGNEPCDAQIRSAADDYTLLEFPAGEYKITEKNAILRTTNIGFRGEGDVRFKAPAGYNEKMLVVDDGTGVLFENIDIDLRADGATPGLHFGVDDDLQVHDVEYIGQGIHPDSDPRGGGNGNPTVTYAFYPIVRSESGTGTVSNVVAKNDGLMGAYNNGNGRVGVWIGISHQGTVTLRNCQFEGFPNNGLYCSRTGGAVQVEGGVFRNNDITQVRLSSRDSHVKNAVISADFDNSASPNPGDTLNSRGVRFEAGRFGYGGASVENCDISIASTPHSGGGVVVGSDGADHTVENSRIGVDVDGIRAFYAKAPTGHGNRGPPPEPHDATIDNVSITGGAGGAEAIRIEQRENSVVSNCCLQQTGGGRDGVRLADSDNSEVRDSTIDVPGQQLLTPGSRVTTSNISDSGSCPAPNSGGGGHTLVIDGAGSRTEYSFTVSGDLEGESLTSEDTISGSTATGAVGGGRDSYGFTGELVSFTLDGEANVTLDGEPGRVGQRPDHALIIDGAGSRTEYSFSVSGGLEGVGLTGEDTISGSTATGAVGGGRDCYGFTGELVSFALDGEANVTLDGEPANVGQRPDHELVIDGAGSRTDYTLTVSGDLEGKELNGADSISGSTATGAVMSGRDYYGFTGELVSFTLDGEANVTLDGDPARVGQRPDHALIIDGAGSRTEYSFSVSGDLEGVGLTPEDSISGSTATGAVGGGRDSYGFSGEITDSSQSGNATAYLNGNEVQL